MKKVSWVVTAEGMTYTIEGSPEVQVFVSVPAEGISQTALEVCL